MKIKPKTKTAPTNNGMRYGKYAEIWKAVQTLGKGEYLPVECDNDKEARNLYCAAKTHRRLNIVPTQRGLTIYFAYHGLRTSEQKG